MEGRFVYLFRQEEFAPVMKVVFSTETLSLQNRSKSSVVIL